MAIWTTLIMKQCDLVLGGRVAVASADTALRELCRSLQRAYEEASAGLIGIFSRSNASGLGLRARLAARALYTMLQLLSDGESHFYWYIISLWIYIVCAPFISDVRMFITGRMGVVPLMLKLAAKRSCRLFGRYRSAISATKRFSRKLMY